LTECVLVAIGVSAIRIAQHERSNGEASDGWSPATAIGPESQELNSRGHVLDTVVEKVPDPRKMYPANVLELNV